ncbi:MAG TPA: hypothetical protein VKH35_13700 [Thermoanaerobaculia bacterium]|nr:hypothetical protein [Thermoanaerobaculia bacterium]
MRRLILLAACIVAPMAGASTLSIRPLTHRFALRATEQGGGFSVDLPIVGRVQGSSTDFSTSLDVTNNTPQSTDVEFFFTPADGSAPRSGLLGTLSGFDNLHVDDFLLALASAGVIAPNQASNSFGTLLLTFTNPSFHDGTEASAVARISSVAGSGGTYGLAYRAQPVETNGPHSLSSVIRNGGGTVTNAGIENLGVDDQGNALTGGITVRLSFYDPATGAFVGPQPTYALAPGQVMQINDLFRQFGLDGSSLLLFVDEIAGTGQIHGYVVLKDVTTNDGAFLPMQTSMRATF